ncbi:MAG: 3-deoxy-D-manno-octulosonic-acid transferase [Bacteroidota bacterium]|nr:3-deoxy-D-manno-octulosonic-acid transferase [Bacteroidota bacterium]
MKLLYNLGILIFRAGGWFISPFNQKARLWIKGQDKWFRRLKERIKYGDKYIWIHCASLGEFEQGRPVIEAIKKEKPHCKVILTFFSPSGYEIRKSYPQADIICYLPADTPGNARNFIELINPELVIYVKYEFWHNYIYELKRRNIPLYLICGIFRKEQHFFRWYGGFFRAMLHKFTRIFVQDKPSMDLLESIGIKNYTASGDTRFDRVLQIASEAGSIPQIEQFRGDERLFLAGSSWKQDEDIIIRYINKDPGRLKWIFAPHEVDGENIGRLEKLFACKCVRYSGFTAGEADARVMIIDNIGMLSSAYRYAYIAEVGGGFGKGIHNVLEPSCWGIPVLFGPEHKRFREALELIDTGGAATFKNYSEFEAIIDRWLTDDNLYRKAAESAGRYVRNNSGATAGIMKEID